MLKFIEKVNTEEPILSKQNGKMAVITPCQYD